MIVNCHSFKTSRIIVLFNEIQSKMQGKLDRPNLDLEERIRNKDAAF